jgi:peptidoglycan/LPS O-acetylase OafA/YrhL
VSALRGFMAEVAGAESQVEWVNTWGFILLPGMLIGALLGLAEYIRRSGGRPRWHLLALSPLLFAAILVAGLIEDPTHMFEGGIGAGAIAIPVLVMIGGHAMSGRGSLWIRVPAGMVGAATLVVWPLTATAVGGPSFALTTPQGLWATVLYDALLLTFALAASVPQREPIPSGTFPVSTSTAIQAQEADHDHSAAV